MVNVGENKNADETTLKAELDKANQAFAPVQKVKQDEPRLTDFEGWNSKLEASFKLYKDSAAYQAVSGIIEASIDKNKGALVFHESNSCPEFWENTRLATGLNVAVPLLKSAQSLIDQ